MPVLADCRTADIGLEGEFDNKESSYELRVFRPGDLRTGAKLRLADVEVEGAVFEQEFEMVAQEGMLAVRTAGCGPGN